MGTVYIVGIMQSPAYEWRPLCAFTDKALADAHRERRDRKAVDDEYPSYEVQSVTLLDDAPLLTTVWTARAIIQQPEGEIERKRLHKAWRFDYEWVEQLGYVPTAEPLVEIDWHYPGSYHELRVSGTIQKRVLAEYERLLGRYKANPKLARTDRRELQERRMAACLKS